LRILVRASESCFILGRMSAKPRSSQSCSKVGSFACISSRSWWSDFFLSLSLPRISFASLHHGQVITLLLTKLLSVERTVIDNFSDLYPITKLQPRMNTIFSQHLLHRPPRPGPPSPSQLSDDRSQ